MPTQPGTIARPHEADSHPALMPHLRDRMSDAKREDSKRLMERLWAVIDGTERA